MDFIAPSKPLQPPITVHDLMNDPAVVVCLNENGEVKRKWSKIMKTNLAAVLSNRCFIDLSVGTAKEIQAFENLYVKVRALVADPAEIQFREAIDPHYIVVQFPGQQHGIPQVPANYRDWLDAANHHIGGAAPAGGGAFTVNGSVANVQPLRLCDSTLINLNFLIANTRPNADFVAGELRVHGLHTWIMSTVDPALYS